MADNEELQTTISALTLEIENLESSLSDKDKQIATLENTIKELREKLDEPEQLTVRSGEKKKESPLAKLSPGELLVFARSKGAI